MVSRLKGLYERHRDIIVYIFFGVLTTAVNYIVYYPLYNLAEFSAAVSNSVAWCAAVLFAFLTNKPFVFHSYDWSVGVTAPEFLKFVGCRLGSGLLETVLLCLTVDIALWNGNIMKLITSVIVVILNYLAGRYMVFKKNNGAA